MAASTTTTDSEKAEAWRLQEFIMEMVKEDENKYCADCEAEQSTCASWNIGVFLCGGCANLHRNLGVRLSKVKSIMGSWTAVQVQSMRLMGNKKSKLVYECRLHEKFKRPQPMQSDQALENFIRAKYETKRYIKKDWVPPEVNADHLPASYRSSKSQRSLTAQPSSSSISHSQILPNAGGIDENQFDALLSEKFAGLFAKHMKEQNYGHGPTECVPKADFDKLENDHLALKADFDKLENDHLALKADFDALVKKVERMEEAEEEFVSQIRTKIQTLEGQLQGLDDETRRKEKTVVASLHGNYSSIIDRENAMHNTRVRLRQQITDFSDVLNIKHTIAKKKRASASTDSKSPTKNKRDRSH